MNTDNIKLNGTVIQGGSLRYPKTPNLLLGENKGYERGDILDANAVSKLIEEGGGGVDPEEIEKIKKELQKKVDKIENKGLSSNDFTTEEKEKLRGLANYDDTEVRGLIAQKQDVISDLATIRSGAEKGATAYQKPAGGIDYNDLSDGINDDLDYGTVAFWDLHDENDGLLWKVPAQASAQNKLADKDFVNSSVSTNTAYYISNNGQPFTSLAQLEAYSGTVTNNDYAFVVGTDAAGNTIYTRYKYNAETKAWSEEYILNNSSFTAAQWAAISSGITSGDVTKLAALPTKAQLDTLFDTKVDKVTGKGLSSNDFTNSEKEKLGALKEWTSEIVYNFQFPNADAKIPIQPIDHKITYVNTTVLGGDSKYFYIMPQFADVGKLKESIYIIKPSANTKVGYGPGEQAGISDSGELLLAGGRYNVVKVNWCLTEDYDPEQPASGKGYVNITVSSDYMTLINTLQSLINTKQDTLTFDNLPTQNSNNPVKSGGVFTALDSKAEKVLVVQEEFPSLSEEDISVMLQPNKIAEVSFVDYMNFAIGGLDNTQKCEYCIKFDVATTIPTLSLPDEIIWAEELKLEANTHYVLLINYENGRFYGDWKSYPLT